MTYLTGLMLAFSVLPTAAIAQDDSSAEVVETTNILDTLAGDWRATGNSFNPNATATMRWSATLDGKFHRVDYRIEMGGGAGFTGIGHYRASDGETTQGYWADNTGDLHRLSVTLTDTAIHTIWGEAGGKQGRTYYELQDDGSVVVTDWLLTKAGWREFNRTVFRRAS